MGRPLIRIRDLKTATPQVWTSEVRAKEVVVEPGDVIVGMDAEFRADWWIGSPGLLNQRTLRASSDVYGPAVVREALVAPLRALENEKMATTVIHLNKSDLVRSSVRVPVGLNLDRARRDLDPLVHVVVQLERESRTLTDIRDTLLPLLMSGRLRVKAAEKQIEAML